MQPIVPDRLQGTDGIRREIRSAKDSECRGSTPLQVFLAKGWITEEFMELYVYCYVKNQSSAHKKRTFVIGWDPRDPSGTFTEAVVRGVRKAGGEARVLGVVPTPLVPLFMLHNGDDGGIMVTASHNPKDQNGIKLFLPFHGMKPLPSDDIDLTQSLLKQNAIKKLPLKGGRTDCRQKALALFQHFSLRPENSWINSPDTLKALILVVDPAFGAFTGIAAQIFKDAGVGKVVEVNAGKNGAVNLRSGVADLEGCPRITADMILQPAGPFRFHKAIVKLFQLGRANQKSAECGKKKNCRSHFRCRWRSFLPPGIRSVSRYPVGLKRRRDSHPAGTTFGIPLSPKIRRIALYQYCGKRPQRLCLCRVNGADPSAHSCW